MYIIHTVSLQVFRSLLFPFIAYVQFQHCYLLTIVRESVIRNLFLIFAREFESDETSPGFARLLEGIYLADESRLIFCEMRKFRTEYCYFTKKIVK